MSLKYVAVHFKWSAVLQEKYYHTVCELRLAMILFFRVYDILTYISRNYDSHQMALVTRCERSSCTICMYFVLKYPLKCIEVCFEVQWSAYLAVLGLHCWRTWVHPIRRNSRNSYGYLRSPWLLNRTPRLMPGGTLCWSSSQQSIYLIAWVGALSPSDWARRIRPSSQSNMPIKGNVREDKLLTFGTIYAQFLLTGYKIFIGTECIHPIK